MNDYKGAYITNCGCQGCITVINEAANTCSLDIRIIILVSANIIWASLMLV
jgi:hypothetical protein